MQVIAGSAEMPFIAFMQSVLVALFHLITQAVMTQAAGEHLPA